MSFRLTRKRRDAAIYLLAHLLLLGYFFQIMAFDHWHQAGVEALAHAGQAHHSQHCHGNSSGCAGLSVDTGSSLQARLAPPLPPEEVTTDADVSANVMVGLSPALVDPPPRAA